MLRLIFRMAEPVHHPQRKSLNIAHALPEQAMEAMWGVFFLLSTLHTSYFQILSEQSARFFILTNYDPSESMLFRIILYACEKQFLIHHPIITPRHKLI